MNDEEYEKELMASILLDKFERDPNHDTRYACWHRGEVYHQGLLADIGSTLNKELLITHKLTYSDSEQLGLSPASIDMILHSPRTRDTKWLSTNPKCYESGMNPLLAYVEALSSNDVFKYDFCALESSLGTIVYAMCGFYTEWNKCKAFESEFTKPEFIDGKLTDNEPDTRDELEESRLKKGERFLS